MAHVRADARQRAVARALDTSSVATARLLPRARRERSRLQSRALAVASAATASRATSSAAAPSPPARHLQGSAADALCMAGLAPACAARRDTFQRACDLGDARACFDLWTRDRDDRRCDAVVDARHARALERATAECTRGFPTSCALIATLAPRDGPRWLPQLRIEAAHGCGAGLLSECELLSTVLAAPDEAARTHASRPTPRCKPAARAARAASSSSSSTIRPAPCPTRSRCATRSSTTASTATAPAAAASPACTSRESSPSPCPAVAPSSPRSSPTTDPRFPRNPCRYGRALRP